MDKNMKVSRTLPADDELVTLPSANRKVGEETRKSAQDTKNKIRSAFSISEKFKATLRA